MKKLIFICLSFHLISIVWAYENIPQYKTGDCLKHYKRSNNSQSKKVVKIQRIEENEYFLITMKEKSNKLFLFEDIAYRSPAGETSWEYHGTARLSHKELDSYYTSTSCPM